MLTLTSVPALTGVTQNEQGITFSLLLHLGFFTVLFDHRSRSCCSVSIFQLPCCSSFSVPPKIECSDSWVVRGISSLGEAPAVAPVNGGIMLLKYILALSSGELLSGAFWTILQFLLTWLFGVWITRDLGVSWWCFTLHSLFMSGIQTF